MRNPELRVRLPADLPSESYEGICLAVSSLLELWGVPDVCLRLTNFEPAARAPGRPGVHRG
ncbi:hypothetical protein [Saccharothrix obliqua]|uniref:hypothetical protein n=1 Tax=Saccharothrix obliqua TaxID=2861747 RepID=UPI001C5E2EA5|nr:hypothetical protein [Saccharothrix obliqua]MBW4721699.1 hypothetical protein [Saccharothrix obliqua]